jgi:protein-S-isoprenylcysteine O-methyltransferase Ste14
MLNDLVSGAACRIRDDEDAGSSVVLVSLLVVTLPVTAWALWKARRDYRRHGKLTWIGLISLCVMLLVPNLMLEYATRYLMPRTVLAWTGVIVGVVGIGICLVSVFVFRSLPKVLCLDAGKLSLSGPYRWSRNPQYVGWFLFLLGFALTDWSLWCLAAMSVVAIALHLLVLVEEEHLRRVFGDPYQEFCRRIPRYIGWAAPR